jgi:hypothetical protein
MHDEAPPDLFGFTPHPASDSDKRSLKPEAAQAKRSPLQREFDRLSARIEEGQALLAAWMQQPAVMLRKYNAQMEPALRDLGEAQKTLIVQLDALLTSPPKGLRMTARRREALTDCLLDLIDAVMEGVPDDNPIDATLIEIHNRYSDDPIDPHAQDDEDEQEAEIIALFGQMFGEGSIERGADESHEDFKERARARLFEAMEAEQRKEDAKRQKRAEKRSAKKHAKKHGKTQPASDDSDTSPGPDLLRTLYRKLASSIHPDREHDVSEKARKTEAMQSLNNAYQSKDLLSLLKLHHQTLQTDATSDALAEDTLREYNALLKAQLKSLESEIAVAIHEAVPPGIALARGRVKRPEQLERLMDEDIRKTAFVAESIRMTVRDLNDPKRRTQAINDLVEMTEANRFEDDFDGMLDEFLR